MRRARLGRKRKKRGNGEWTEGVKCAGVTLRRRKGKEGEERKERKASVVRVVVDKKEA